MNNLKTAWTLFRYAGRNEEGVTVVEYALIAALIAVAIASSVSGLATTLKTQFSAIGSAL